MFSDGVRRSLTAALSLGESLLKNRSGSCWGGCCAGDGHTPGVGTTEAINFTGFPLLRATGRAKRRMFP